jgi:hypothetical protein
VSRVRRPAVAGTFYPRDSAELRKTVDRLLGAAPHTAVRPRGLVVPHAGYVYSGPVAATAYRQLENLRPIPTRVALLGPAHFVPLVGAAVPGLEAWSTPLGEVPIDQELLGLALKRGARMDDAPHEPEHALEVQLPFIQRALPADCSILPVAIGAMKPSGVADLVAELIDQALVVVSTDLSHYHDAETARGLDLRTADAVVRLDVGAIGPQDACGVHALRGIVSYARSQGKRIALLDLRSSADTAGDPLRVVGYGAFSLS